MVTDDDVVALIGEGVDVNVTDAMGKSALLLAAGNGHVEVVRALLDAGANPNLAYTSGATALHWAALNGHAEVVAMLLGVNGIDTTLKDSNGRTAFTVAAAADHTDIAQSILEAMPNEGKPETSPAAADDDDDDDQCQRRR